MAISMAMAMAQIEARKSQEKVKTGSLVGGVSLVDEETISNMSQEKNFYKPKILGKMFTLPLITDTYNRVVSLTAALEPYVGSFIEHVNRVACKGFDKVLEVAPILQKYGFADAYQYGNEYWNSLPKNIDDCRDLVTNSEVRKQVMHKVQRYKERMKQVQAKNKEDRKNAPTTDQTSATEAPHSTESHAKKPPTTKK